MTSELGSLFKLAVSQGATQTDLVIKIKQAVLAAYTQKYPKAPITTEVIVDIESGKIRLLAGDEDITPAAFRAEVEQSARRVVIESLTPETHAGETKLEAETHPKASGGNAWGMIFLFWGYHLFYLVYFGLLAVGLLFGGALVDLVTIGKNWSIFQISYGLILLATPLAATGYVLYKHIGKEGQQLSKLFFRVEIPTLFLAGVSLLVAASSIPLINFFLLILLISPVFIYFNQQGLVNLPYNKQQAVIWLAIWITLTLIYGLILWTFVVGPLTGTAAQAFFEDFFANLINPYGRYGDLISMPVDILGNLVSFGFRLLGFLLVEAAIWLPYLLTYVLLKKWRKDFEVLAASEGNKFSKWVTVGAVVWLAVVVVLSVPGGYPKSAKQLGTLLKANNYSEKLKIAQELVPRKSEVTADIKQIYERRENYLLTAGNDFISEGYHEVLGFPEPLADAIQTVFLAVAYPFVYQEKVPWDELDEAYTYLYGHGVWGTPQSEFPQNKNVKLVSRDIKVDSLGQGPLGQVIYGETYTTNEWSDQEVIYEFTLPPEAVVTGLKLGPNLEYEGQIAPRGAAQQTYQQELVQRRDPALLEQIGSSLYRLRVFPIPGTNNTTMPRGKPQKIEIIYLTPLTPDGFYLPQVIRAQNLMTDKTVKLSAQVDGEWVSFDSQQNYIPPSPAIKESLCQIKWKDTDQVDLGVSTATLSNFDGQASCQPGLPKGSSPIKIAVLIDTSAGAGHEKAIKELASLSDLSENYQVEIMPFNDLTGEAVAYAQWKDTLVNNQVNFGKHSLDGLNKIVNQGNYDAYIILTGKQFSATEWQSWSIPKNTPIYLVPSRGGVSLDPERITTMIQSGSYIFASITEALRYAYQAKLVNEAGMPGMYWWTKLDNNQQYNLSQITGLMTALGEIKTASTAASQVTTQVWIQQSLKTYAQPVMQNLSLLDAYHNLAVETHFITPYSSLIALVNAQQQQNLDNLSQDYDRFDEQQFTQNQGGGVISVPRPRGMPITGIFSPMLGADILNSNKFTMEYYGAPAGFGGGGGGMGIAMALDGDGSGIGLPGGFSGLFIIVNILLLGGGSIVWVGGKIKERRRLKV
ncbi:hypothetical protein A2W24_02955 [Microgenomates group bacterium RBG_16_45_19]|nr:MAG: hypothetical protein A2W24_02955 [Microgenomates group bacterium RBG_16_45_19]